MADYDLITDILQRLTAKGVPVPSTVAQEVDADVRREWGGKKHYISLRGELLMRRDDCILTAFRAGKSAEELARQWGLTRRRIKQIVTP